MKPIKYQFITKRVLACRLSQQIYYYAAYSGKYFERATFKRSFIYDSFPWKQWDNEVKREATINEPNIIIVSSKVAHMIGFLGREI